jgi:hypothetical protein
MSNVGGDGGGGKPDPLLREDVELIREMIGPYWLLAVHGKRCKGQWTLGERRLERHWLNQWLYGGTPAVGHNVGWFLGGTRTKNGKGFCCLDVDYRNGGEEALCALVGELGPLPLGVADDREDGGPHFYYLIPPDLLDAGARQRSRVILGPGLELLANHAFANVPPSIGSNGRRRRWLTPPPLPDKLWTFSDLPPEWQAFVRSKVLAPAPPPPLPSSPPPSPSSPSRSPDGPTPHPPHPPRP